MTYLCNVGCYCFSVKLRPSKVTLCSNLFLPLRRACLQSPKPQALRDSWEISRMQHTNAQHPNIIRNSESESHRDRGSKPESRSFRPWQQARLSLSHSSSLKLPLLYSLKASSSLQSYNFQPFHCLSAFIPLCCAQHCVFLLSPPCISFFCDYFLYFFFFPPFFPPPFPFFPFFFGFLISAIVSREKCMRQLHWIMTAALRVYVYACMYVWVRGRMHTPVV
jgi:hypothetical protein